MIARLLGKNKKKENGAGEALKTKITTCSNCGLNLNEPEQIRCPRCFALVAEHRCSGCGKCE